MGSLGGRGNGAARWRVAVLALLLIMGCVPGAGSAVDAAAVTAPGSTGFVLPVAPPPLLLTPFAPPANRYGAGHRGVDLAAAPGATVVAAGAGRVVFAGMLAGRGVVSIEHAGGLRTTYEPVTAAVSAGSVVAAGQQIGAVEPGHAGCVPASCLHWGARLPDRVYLDPMSLLAPWRVRLLPWSGR
jgi:murein DD-endopeptidase MepM/ murein hydrolase activator NlpD